MEALSSGASYDTDQHQSARTNKGVLPHRTGQLATRNPELIIPLGHERIQRACLGIPAEADTYRPSQTRIAVTTIEDPPQPPSLLTLADASWAGFSTDHHADGPLPR